MEEIIGAWQEKVNTLKNKKGGNKWRVKQLKKETTIEATKEIPIKVEPHKQEFRIKLTPRFQPYKRRDIGDISISINIGWQRFKNVLCDMGALVNVMPLQDMIDADLKINDPQIINLQVVDDHKMGYDVVMVLGRPLLNMPNAEMIVRNRKITMSIDDKPDNETIVFVEGHEMIKAYERQKKDVEKKIEENVQEYRRRCGNRVGAMLPQSLGRPHRPPPLLVRDLTGVVSALLTVSHFGIAGSNLLLSVALTFLLSRRPNISTSSVASRLQISSELHHRPLHVCQCHHCCLLAWEPLPP
ncbi:hypothetical protein Sjap_008054 [Stephania japonica]|uniref:Uncharacterized protein n=1 Tax=Stephania japonica TaxID=461633 RepID=A0AAP0JR03_9MAGN